MPASSLRSNVANVLVIGTGAAGLRAAIAAYQAGSEVVVIGKRARKDAHTVLAAGGINAALGSRTGIRIRRLAGLAWVGGR
jgi:succinate dehydrogenase flavoprotein subunit